VILVSLVGEGLTLPALIRAFGDTVRPDTEAERRAFDSARRVAAEAARDRLRSLEPSFGSTEEWEVAGRITAGYEVQMRVVEGPDGAREGDLVEVERNLRRQAYAAERSALLELRRAGAITDDVFQDLNWNIDLAESRWS